MALSATSIDKHGNVVGFGLHDAGLVGLLYEDAGVLAVRLRRVDRHVVTVSLRGVGPVGFVGFRSGAIVSSLFVWAPAKASLSTGAIPRTAWAVLFGNDIPVDDLPKAVVPIVKEDQFSHLVFLQCSYGGSMAALCREVEVEVDS